MRVSLIDSRSLYCSACIQIGLRCCNHPRVCCFTVSESHQLFQVNVHIDRPKWNILTLPSNTRHQKGSFGAMRLLIILIKYSRCVCLYTQVVSQSLNDACCQLRNVYITHHTLLITSRNQVSVLYPTPFYVTLLTDETPEGQFVSVWIVRRDGHVSVHTMKLPFHLQTKESQPTTVGDFAACGDADSSEE